MHKINVLIDNKRYWIKEFPCLENFARLQMRKFFSEINFLSSVKLELTILFTSGKRVKELNKKFRNKNTDTDVLSFPSMSKDFYKSRIKLKELYLGDIALSYDYIKKMLLKYRDEIEKARISEVIFNQMDNNNLLRDLFDVDDNKLVYIK